MARKKALRKLAKRLRKAAQGYLSSVGRDDQILNRLDFTVADCQQLVAALMFETAYFVRLSVLFADDQGENVSPDLVKAQEHGVALGYNAADKTYKELSKGFNIKKERPA